MTASQTGRTGGADQGPSGGVLIVDFGAQYCQLIARRVRELGVYSRITVPERAMFTFAAMRPQAVILSGGPRSVYEHDAPKLDRAILEQGVPVLGICYGLQWMAQNLGGEVTPAQSGAEYGRTELQVVDGRGFLQGVRDGGIVWMSHGDKVSKLPQGFEVLGKSEPCPFAVVADMKRKFIGLQFHPEVAHTVDGQQMLNNFVLSVAKCSTDWDPGHIVDRKVQAVRELVGETGEVVLGLSGGVDSSVAAAIVHKAIGSRLHCVFVDNGLLRRKASATASKSCLAATGTWTSRSSTRAIASSANCRASRILSRSARSSARSSSTCSSTKRRATATPSSWAKARSIPT